MSSTSSYFKRERGISPEMLHRERASSRDDRGATWYSRVAEGFLNYDGELREPLMLPQGSQVSIRVARGSWGLLLSHCRANRPHQGLCPETVCSSPVRQGSRGCIQGSPEESGLVSSGGKELLSLLELRPLSLGAH